MFRQTLLESLKARMAQPEFAGLPLHARVQRVLKQMILEGVLAAGKPLPASRQLAQSLAVSRDTVEMAYSHLHAEGFIERRVGSGSFVSTATRSLRGRAATARQLRPSTQAPRLSQRGAAMLSRGAVREQSAPRPFAPGVPETRLFPLSTWERLQRQVLKEYGTQTLRHGDPQGTEALRRAIADYLNLERGARASADQVLVLTSSQQALNLCATVLLDAGERIFIEDPAYYGASKAFKAAELETLPVAVDSQGLIVDTLINHPQPARVAYVTPSHQFPTGVTLSLERRLALIDWAAKQQAWIIEDDYDSEFHYAGRPTACVQGLDMAQRTIYIGTFTKSLFPGLRIGYMVLPPALVAPMTLARTLQDGHSAPLAQLTLARFIAGGHFGAYVRSMRNVYAERLDLLAGLLQQHLCAFMTAQVPAGGLQMPCRLTGELGEHQVIDRARQVGIDVLGLSGLYAGKAGAEGILMGFAAYTPEEIQAAIVNLAQALRQG